MAMASTPTVTVTLAGKQFTSERLPNTAYVAIAAIVKEKGKPMPDLSANSARLILAETIMLRLGDSSFFRDLAYALLWIFPSIPDDLVWFAPDSNMRPPYGVNLEIKEILDVVFAVGQALTDAEKAKLQAVPQAIAPHQPPDATPHAPALTPPVDPPVALDPQQQRILDLETELAQLRGNTV